MLARTRNSGEDEVSHDANENEGADLSNTTPMMMSRTGFL